MTPYSTGNFQLPPLAAHLVAIGMAAVAFYVANQQFMSHMPVLVQDAAPPTLAFLTWLGVTQVQATQPPIAPE